MTHYYAIVGSDDDSDSDEQARKDQADLAAFRAKEKKAQATKTKKKEYARQYVALVSFIDELIHKKRKFLKY